MESAFEAFMPLCQTWSYEFDNPIDTPVGNLALTELPARHGPLAFLFPTNEKPTFANDQIAVTREAADAATPQSTRWLS